MLMIGDEGRNSHSDWYSKWGHVSENSVKRAGKSCDSARLNNDFTLGFESQSAIKSD